MSTRLGLVDTDGPASASWQAPAEPHRRWVAAAAPENRAGTVTTSPLGRFTEGVTFTLQRLAARNRFLDDIYAAQEIIHGGVDPEEVSLGRSAWLAESDGDAW